MRFVYAHHVAPVSSELLANSAPYATSRSCYQSYRHAMRSIGCRALQLQKFTCVPLKHHFQNLV